MEHLTIRKNDNILIIAPHPDDECIGVGGILLLYPDNTEVVVLTDGCIGQGDLNQHQTSIKRKNEFIDEMSNAGIKKYYFGNVKDGTLINHLDCLYDFDMSKYTKVFVTSVEDGHSDHVAAYFAVKNAMMKQAVNPEVYLYEVHAGLSNPTHVLNITNVIDRKRELIRFHKSQLVCFPYDEYAVVTAKYRAMQNRQPNSFYEVYSLDNEETKVLGRNIDTERKLQKYVEFYRLLIKWLEKRNKGKWIEDILIKEKISTVAIYGYAGLGKLLQEELSLSKSIIVEFAIDKKEVLAPSELDVFKPSDARLGVDAVIVTVLSGDKDIKAELEEKGYMKIYCLRDLIERM